MFSNTFISIVLSVYILMYDTILRCSKWSGSFLEKLILKTCHTDLVWSKVFFQMLVSFTTLRETIFD